MENQNRFLHHDMKHDMTCNDTLCHDSNNTTICYESCHEKNQLSKEDWWYLVETLTSWRVFAPRAVIKKNPQLAWRIMNICKDPSVRVKGAYFTTCFKRELYKLENEEKLAYWRSVARGKLGIA